MRRSVIFYSVQCIFFFFNGYLFLWLVEEVLSYSEVIKIFSPYLQKHYFCYLLKQNFWFLHLWLIHLKLIFLKSLCTVWSRRLRRLHIDSPAPFGELNFWFFLGILQNYLTISVGIFLTLYTAPLINLSILWQEHTIWITVSL